MEPRRRSKIVMWSLIGLPVGALALGEAFPGQQMRRNLYADRAACERDYSAAQCETNSGSGAYSGFYHGPYYIADRTTAAARGDAGPGRTGQVTAGEVSTRGGFGAFGRALHGVG
jgi:hypothetical protein